MIICSFDKPEIGKIYRNVNLSDADKIERLATFLVIREATKEEFIEWCKECGTDPNEDMEPELKFYKISMD